MKSVRPNIIIAIALVASLICILRGSETPKFPEARRNTAKISIDYPLNDSVFPPEITPPTFLWRDESNDSRNWVLRFSFPDQGKDIQVKSAGEHPPIGDLDPQAGSGEELKELQVKLAAMWMWKPSPELWTEIKRRSTQSPLTITITGYADEGGSLRVSEGTVNISTSIDPVGAPIFYRDVPLILSPHTEKGAIQPLPPFAIPLIKWRLRSIGDTQSRTVMGGLPTCANCHSFSSDGKTLGLDVDGPKNDKGLYALVPVEKNMTIRNQNVIRWSSFQENDLATSEPAVKRFGFMSQVSPDGRYVVTSIGPPSAGNLHQKENPDFAPGLSDRLFSTTYMHVDFTQVFYPTRGILVWYDRKEGKLRPLPGADDPRYVQTSAFWSPDGKYLIYSRTEARDPYPEGAPKPEYANDPKEPQVHYDLYKIPFNEGKGGKAEPVRGASENGMSNNFPKVSPDGRWIVFVQNKTGLLMRPDSKLYMVPFNGGKARLMTCNTALMNSWHSFSPNGRWLAFSSKARSPYTQLLLTHIDANGNDSPPVIVENTTATNRAVNIPEFVNVSTDGIEKIDPQATEFYRLFNRAFELMEKNQMTEALPVLREALARDPEDALAHYAMATALTNTNQEGSAVEEYRKACELNPRNAAWLSHLAVSQALTGNMPAAISNWRKSLALEPKNAGAEADLGTALFENGQPDEGYEHLKKAIEMAPDFPDAHSHLGWELAKIGRLDESIEELQKAIQLRPNSVEFHANLGYVLEQKQDFAGAVTAFQKAVELSGGNEWRVLDLLAHAYAKLGLNAEAAKAERQAVELAVRLRNPQLERRLRNNLEQYEGNQPK